MNLKPKPPVFKAGSTSISAKALNEVANRAPRVITGGPGISVSGPKDKVIVSYDAYKGKEPGAITMATITAIKGTYLECTKDGATIKVAKPWGLRKDADIPSGVSYSYSSDGSSRQAGSGEDGEEQFIVPAYQTDEELLVVRVPSTRIKDDDDAPIVWADLNTLGRSWAANQEEPDAV